MSERLMNPLLEYENLIQNGGIERCYQKFLSDAYELLGEDIRNDILEFQIIEQDECGEYQFYMEYFEERINEIFQKAFTITIYSISNELGACKSVVDLKARLTILLDALWFLYNCKNRINTHKQSERIDFWLSKLTSFFRDKYPHTNSHIVYTLLGESPIGDNNPDGYFGFKRTRDELKKLWKMVLIELGLFSEDNLKVEDFITVILCEKPQELDIKLKFHCTQGKAAFILEKLKPFFYNLNDTALVQSTCFQTRQEKDLVLGNFQTARSKYKSSLSNEDAIKEINKIFKNYKR